MPALSSIYSSSSANASLIGAFMSASKASILNNLFTQARDPANSDSFQLAASMPAFDASFYTAMVRGGNLSAFGSVYKDSASFNQNLMGSVAASAGLKWDTAGDSLTSQMIDQMG